MSIVGQCELIGRIYTFAKWANTSLLAEYTLERHGPIHAHQQTAHICTMGQYELVGRIRARAPRAYASISAAYAHEHCRPTQADRQNICMCILGPSKAFAWEVFYLLWAITISSAATVCMHCGPMRVVWSAAVLLAALIMWAHTNFVSGILWTIYGPIRDRSQHNFLGPYVYIHFML